MTVLLINDTSAHANWGCGATSAGLKKMLAARYGDGAVLAVPAGRLPYGRWSVRGAMGERKARAVLDQDAPSRQDLASVLAGFGVDPQPIETADHVVVNGEGMIHAKSRHLPKLLTALAYAKVLGKPASMVNQTVDLGARPDWLARTARVYGQLDTVWVRDPISADALRAAGVAHARLVPDAAFLTVPGSPDDCAAAAARAGLPGRFVALTGSSALKPRDVSAFGALCEATRAAFGLPLVMMASTKTDMKLATALNGTIGFAAIIGPQTPWQEAVRLFGAAHALVGGRFHPMIFAALHGVPVLGLSGNTHKSEGLMQLLANPVPALAWGDDAALKAGLAAIAARRDDIGAGLARSAADAARQIEAAPLFTPPHPSALVPG